jgi:signal transduction histidine kinase/CheY-like chemotaxis protein
MRSLNTNLYDWLQETRGRGILIGILWLYGAGLILINGSTYFRLYSQHLWLSLFMFLVIGGVALASRWHRLVSAWVLVIGGLAAVSLVVVWGGLEGATPLWAIFIGLSALTISPLAGVVCAVVCAFLLLGVPSSLTNLTMPTRVVTLLSIGGSLSLVWLILRPLSTVLAWAWMNYQESRLALEQARDQQVRLYEMTEDLAAANLQLTRLNRLAQGLRQMAEEERRAKEQFVANVSHELRTPLNMIIGFCEMITNSPQTYGGRIPPTLLADLEVVLRNSRHLAELIDDVLDLSQIETGRMALIKERVSLAEIINSAIVATRPLFVSKGLCLESDVPESLPLVFCDRTRVREVVLNLLSNAGRFTEKGGVQVKAWQEGDEVIVSVSDTGPGIAEQDQARLFQPFEQLDGSIRKRYGGTGLGLTISKEFVELHGGRMWVESKVGHGTTFFFRLPIDPPAPLGKDPTRWLNPYQPYEERARPFRGKPSVPRPRLVVLEQYKGLNRLLSRYLDAVEVVLVSDPTQAIQALNQTPAEALLINERALDKALNRLNDLGRLPYNLPIIITTIPGEELAAETLGASGYLVKPITRKMLLEALDRLDGEICKVLIIDDEPEALRLFSRMLTEEGRRYRVLRASGVLQALQILEHERPDVILLDLVMPDVDGFQFLSLRESSPSLKEIPVILLSARDPSGQPVISNGLVVTCANGMSSQQVLSTIEALITTLSRVRLSADLVPTATSPD